MIVVMSTEAKQEQVDVVLERISDMGMSGHVSPGADRVMIKPAPEAIKLLPLESH